MFRKSITAAAIALVVLVLAGNQRLAVAFSGEGTGGPDVGQPAPDFKLPYATAEETKYNPAEGMSLSQYRGKTVVLAFYPADWSSGCTTEVCTFRDTFKDLGNLGAVILGISGDYVFSHHEWITHHKLTFPLLSDHDHSVAKTYASYDPKFGYNKRTVYVVDGSGTVRYRSLDFKAGSKADYEALRDAISKAKM